MAWVLVGNYTGTGYDKVSMQYREVVLTYNIGEYLQHIRVMEINQYGSYSLGYVSPTLYTNTRYKFDWVLKYKYSSTERTVSGSNEVTTPSSATSTNHKFETISGMSTGDTVTSFTVALYRFVPDPPSIPSSISVPSIIRSGETVPISWGIGTGASSYNLERSINGGAYSQIYSGVARSHTDNAQSNWNTVAYRVRSYNVDGYSDYRTSSTVTVTHNSPPSIPSSITVPELRSGQSSTISWGASTDSDGDTINYYLERSINGGSYSIIRSGGTSRTFIDTPQSNWNTVSYRVRAYDGTVYSGYRTSSTVTVKHFPEFYVKVNGVSKTSDNGWVKINGALREIESITVKINGVLREV